MKIKFFFLFLALHTVTTKSSIKIDFKSATEKSKKLPRFWTNSGFSPPQPIENVNEFFGSTDVNLNLEIIGSLPNNAIDNVRIHWILNLLSIGNYSKKAAETLPVFDFDRLDKFLWKLTNDYQLKPTIEFMTTLRPHKIDVIYWESLAYQLVARYIGRYGVKTVTKWKFETWNEPDLAGYNLLNFTEKGFADYVVGIKEGIKAAERQFSMVNEIKLRGPAGLFKDKEKHKFCWGLLNTCNENQGKCPIDVITFHRKGEGNNAKEILNGSLDLLKEINQDFPNLKNFMYSNTEADPIQKWSESRDFQADTRYAAVLVETVLEHWQAIYDGRMKNLESISHDNAFLNFYPSFFTQRTLLARFQMNNTTPKHIQFVQKPVYSALGMMGNLGTRAGKVRKIRDKNISFIITFIDNPQRFYANILLWSHVDLRKFANKTETIEIEIENLNRNKSGELFYFVEGIDNERTNPWEVFKSHKSPDFPDPNVFEAMRNVHNPISLAQPAKVFDGKIILNLQLMAPFVVTVRVCSRNENIPKKVKNVRLRKVNNEEIILFWSDSFYKSRCIKSFKIFFQFSNQDYKRIDTRDIPFMYYQMKHTIPGCFKIQSEDIFGRLGNFSRPICYEGN